MDLSVFEQFTLHKHTHVYKSSLSPKTKLRSVSSVYEKLKPPFPKYFAARGKANNTGQTPEEVMAEWDSSNLKARDLGNEVHYYIKEFLLGEEDTSLAPEPLKNQFQSFYSTIIKNKMSVVGVEQIVGSTKLGIAGTLDLLVKTNRGGYKIFDWKTNKAISLVSKNSKKLLPPMEGYQACEFNYYTMQLNLYRYIIELETGCKISGLSIVWLNENNPDYIIFDLPILPKSLIKEIINVSNNQTATEGNYQ